MLHILCDLISVIGAFEKIDRSSIMFCRATAPQMYPLSSRGQGDRAALKTLICEVP